MIDASREPAAPPCEREDTGAPPLQAIVIGSGFGGIGMAVALRKAGVTDFVVLEKAAEVGGVWRDNSYPGAACDVPSHLYSFSFEPNPDWTRSFAGQADILAYLRRCVQSHSLEPYIRFHAEVTQAAYDEARSLWRVTLADGAILEARLLVSATGQLSRPALPRLAGIEQFRGHSFHSAQWEHGFEPAGKRIAVIGTGASAAQFVPPLAGKASQLLVFQRSPAHIIPRPDRAYTAVEKTLFRHARWTMRLHRGWLYTAYELRALAFTRFNGLLKLAVGSQFRRLLARQLADPSLRAKLTPDYAIGCKRILLSNEYYLALGQPNVSLLTEPIRRITADGIETADGMHHPVDAIVYGTGFKATGFLAPMRITGRGGCDLNDAWRGGAKAYLGMTVPGFPNFFMLYGPNTNLGHNSILYMVEGQIAHVMRCWREMQATASVDIEIDRARYRKFTDGIARRLAHSVWSGCTSWYVDQDGHQSINWPGFSLTYRWLTRFSSLQAYRLTRPLAGAVHSVALAAPRGLLERATAGFLRGFIRTAFRSMVGPPWGPGTQRRVATVLAVMMPGILGVPGRRVTVGSAHAQVLAPAGEEPGASAILYVHGGAYCLGGPFSHRSITTRLARDSGMTVWVPDYRLAPENPYPGPLDDVHACYKALLESGVGADRVVLAGDSAGAALALALAMRLRDAGMPVPAGLMMISPVADPSLSDPTVAANARIDPMVRKGWIEQGLRWYGCPPEVAGNRPLVADLSGLPPMFIQVGEQEILLSDSTRLAARARQCGVDCRLEMHQGRWHVFHLESFYLSSARAALRTLAGFANACVLAAHQASAPRTASAPAPAPAADALLAD
jgi:cation diffusion facilitator CzcD-associated flavoprotein CzcO/acetyl esterase/lipase